MSISTMNQPDAAAPGPRVNGSNRNLENDKISLAEQSLSITTERIENLNGLVQDQLQAMENNNKKLTELTTDLNQLREEYQKMVEDKASEEDKAKKQLDIDKKRGEIEQLSALSNLDTIKLQQNLYNLNTASEFGSNLARRMFEMIKPILSRF